MFLFLIQLQTHLDQAQLREVAEQQCYNRDPDLGEIVLLWPTQ